MLTFLSANIKSLDNSVLNKLFNNKLLFEMIESIDFDQDDEGTKFNNQQKMLLEIHLKLEEMNEECKIKSQMRNSCGIAGVKRGKKILKEKEKF